jgi:hypothetical protein
MKNIYISLLMVTCSLMFSSCNDLWDLNMDPGKPVFDGTTSSAGLVEAQLTAAYSYFLYAESMGQYYWGDIGGIDTDESYRQNIASNSMIPNAHNITPYASSVSSVWKIFYKVNESANNVLLMIPKAKDMSQTEADDARGQAMTLKAFSHFFLTVNFGDVPIKDVATFNMGLNDTISRMPTKQVCQYALDLCRKSIPLLKSLSDTKSTAVITKSAAEALSYRIALYMASHPAIHDVAKYDSIVSWADSFIVNGPNKLNTSPMIINGDSIPAYARLFVKNVECNNSWNSETDPEGIWTIAFFCKSTSSGTYEGGRYRTDQRLGSWMGIPCPDTNGKSEIGFCDLSYRALNNLYDKYTDFSHGSTYPIGDLRRDWNIPTFCYKNYYSDNLPTGYSAKTRYSYFKVYMPTGITCKKEATFIPVFDKQTWTESSGTLKDIYMEDGGYGYKDANGNSTFTVNIPKITSKPSTLANVNIANGGIIGYKTGRILRGGLQVISGYNNLDGVTIDVVNGKVVSVSRQSNTEIGSSFTMVNERGIGKWRREYEVNLPPIRDRYSTACQVPILRFADVLLMASEAHLMSATGNKALGLEYLNMVRRRAYGADVYKANPAVDFPAYNLQTIMDERSRELCFEGLRRMDLVRWNAYLGDNGVIHQIQTENPSNNNLDYAVRKLAENYDKYKILPIPNAEISVSHVSQNTGW